MTQKEKLIERLLSRPKDFTFDEARRLFAIFDYTEDNKGATSGSRVAFYPPKEIKSDPFLLHRPHPGNILKPGVVRGIIKHLSKNNLIYNYLNN